jgi:predicted anti-sigma-YlaC factor YlaD
MRRIITCKQTHELVSKSMDQNLSVIDRLRVRFHLSICQSCTNFTHQMQMIRKAMRKFPLEDIQHDHSDTK